MLIIWFGFEQYVTRKISHLCNLHCIHTPLFVFKCDQKTFTFLPTIQGKENKKIIVCDDISRCRHSITGVCYIEIKDDDVWSFPETYPSMQTV